MWVEEDLWWEGLMEKMCLEFRVEESGSDGWREWIAGRPSEWREW